MRSTRSARDLVIYNAGSDPFVNDPLAGLRLTKSDLADRELLVVSLVRERSIPSRWCYPAAIPPYHGGVMPMQLRAS